MSERPRHLIVPEENYYYTKNHEWVCRDDKNSVTVGITYYAQDQLGEIVSWKLPQKGKSFDVGEVFGWVESNKNVSDLYMPVAGEVVEVNHSLSPDLLSDNPMDKGWLIRVEFSNEEDISSLLHPQEYRKLIEEEVKSVE